MSIVRPIQWGDAPAKIVLGQGLSVSSLYAQRGLSQPSPPVLVRTSLYPLVLVRVAVAFLAHGTERPVLIARALASLVPLLP